MPCRENTLNAGSPRCRSPALAVPRCGDSSRLQATVLRMPGTISGTSAATRAKPLPGVLVLATSQASRKPITVQTIAVAPA